MLDIFTLAQNLDITKLSTYEIIIGAILIVASLLIILVVLLQEGRQANVGVISGAADSFLDKGAAKTLDQKLAKWTKVIAVGFFVLVLGGMLVTKFLSNNAIMVREAEKAAKTQTSASAVVSDNQSTGTQASGTGTQSSGTSTSVSASASK